MADNDVPAEADEVSDDELEEADEESFPASDPPATWSGPKRMDEPKGAEGSDDSPTDAGA